jgi:hypothetical protein
MLFGIARNVVKVKDKLKGAHLKVAATKSTAHSRPARRGIKFGMVRGHFERHPYFATGATERAGSGS